MRRSQWHLLGGGVALLALAGCARPESAPAPLPALHARALTDVRFERTPERRERGRYLATAAIGCVVCHSERDRSQPGAPPVPGREFAGAVMAEEPGYRLVAPNLTPDVATGAGTWTDDMLARAIREGVGHDGRGLGGEMFWWAFRALSDEDLASIVVYLRSLPAVAHALPPRMLSAEQEQERAESAQPLTEPVAARDLADPLVRGTYLVEIADCLGCHSAWEAPTNPGIGAGGNPIARFGEHAFSANLTPDRTGIGGYTEGIFRGVLRSGHGGTLHPAMPWVAYRHLTDADIGAIYQALRQLPPVAHRVASVNSGEKPTKCPVCGQEHGYGELNVPLVLERAVVDLGPLDAYVGSYLFGIDSLAVSTRDGALYVSENGGRAIEAVPVAGGRFRGIGLAAPFSFEKDATGEAVALVTYDLGTTRWVREAGGAP
jgi:mono/diheme cytochrome c family protein